MNNQNNQNNGKTHIKVLTDACQNVCTFINTITVDNISKDEKINSFEAKIDELQCLCSDLKTQLEQINESVKILASLLNFTINQDDSTIDILTRWILSFSKKSTGSMKKRKMCSSYSPLKLSIKDTIEVNDSMENKQLKCATFEKENKNSSQGKLKNIWKLEIKRDGKPSDLLRKSKQMTLKLKPQEEKIKKDITTINISTPKISVLNSTSSFDPEIFSIKKNDISKKYNENNLIHNTQMDDPNNISLSHFNKIIKVNKKVLPTVKTIPLKSNETNISHQNDENNQPCDETICSPLQISVNELNNAIESNDHNKIPNRNLLDSFDIIPGLNDIQNNLPNYKFKEDPVRKRNERKLLNGWDCEDCCKFYKANNDNPVEAKTAMNHFSRHRSVKNQNHASTPPGFWDPI